MTKQTNPTGFQILKKVKKISAYFFSKERLSKSIEPKLKNVTKEDNVIYCKNRHHFTAVVCPTIWALFDKPTWIKVFY
jgi:hypothetical protein